MEDSILINGLELSSRLGVCDEERGKAQRVTAVIRLVPARRLSGLGDDLRNTIDYAAVCEAVRAQVETGERRLLETLAEDVALLLLERFALLAVEIELRKYIVPGVGFTAVHIRREWGIAPSS